MAIPKLPMERNTFASFSGKRSAKIFDPSSGGIGSKLKIARSKFSSTIFIRNISSSDARGRNRMRKPKKTAIRIFVNGPASDTRARSFLPSFKLKGSIGTGFAAPKIIGNGKGAIGSLGITKITKAIDLRNPETRKIGKDLLIEGYL